MELKDRYSNLDECLEDYVLWYRTQQSRIVTPTSCLHFLRLASDGLLFLLHGLRNRLIDLKGVRKDVNALDKALNDHTEWYTANHDTITDVVPMLQFLKRAMDKSLGIIHMLRDELREAEEKEALGSGLWLPSGLRPYD
jgi:hypothetical protein